MDNQHKLIAGYRDLSAVEIELMNQVKAKGEELRALLDQVQDHVDNQHIHARQTGDVAEMERLQDADPARWHADAKHSLQCGIMYAVRAIAQPTTF